MSGYIIPLDLLMVAVWSFGDHAQALAAGWGEMR